MKKRDLIEACKTLKGHAIARHLGTPEEVTGYWPERGEKAPLGEWVRCYAQLTRINGRQEFMQPGNEYAVSQLMGALSSEPIDLTLDSGESVKVYPKSYHALRVLEAQSWWIEWLGVRVMAIQESAKNYEAEVEAGNPRPLGSVTEPEGVLTAAINEIDHRMSVMCWVACWDGGGIPWAGDEVPPPSVVPALFRDLSPLDIERIQKATVQVNIARLRYLPRLGESGKGVTPDVFFATRAKNTGRPMRELMMDEPLAQQIAEVSLAQYSIDDLTKKGSKK